MQARKKALSSPWIVRISRTMYHDAWGRNLKTTFKRNLSALRAFVVSRRPLGEVAARVAQLEEGPDGQRQRHANADQEDRRQRRRLLESREVAAFRVQQH